MNITNQTSWVFYDGHCKTCVRWAKRCARLLINRDFIFLSLQNTFARKMIGLTENEEITEMKLLTKEGVILGGVDALCYLSREIWWTWPFYALAKIPFIKGILNHHYKKQAKNRYCFGGRCDVYEIKSVH